MIIFAQVNKYYSESAKQLPREGKIGTLEWSYDDNMKMFKMNYIDGDNPKQYYTLDEAIKIVNQFKQEYEKGPVPMWGKEGIFEWSYIQSKNEIHIYQYDGIDQVTGHIYGVEEGKNIIRKIRLNPKCVNLNLNIFKCESSQNNQEKVFELPPYAKELDEIIQRLIQRGSLTDSDIQRVREIIAQNKEILDQYPQLTYYVTNDTGNSPSGSGSLSDYSSDQRFVGSTGLNQNIGSGTSTDGGYYSTRNQQVNSQYSRFSNNNNAQNYTEFNQTQPMNQTNDYQLQQRASQSNLEANVGNAILGSAGNIYNNVVNRSYEKKIIEQNQNRDKRFQELRNRIESEGGELVSCLNCSGVGSNKCLSCKSSGKISCGTCSGRGGETCMTCKGAGSYELSGANFTCASCNGKRVNVCYTCNSTGKETCASCYGLGVRLCSNCAGTGKEFRRSQKINNSSAQNISANPSQSANSYSNSANQGTNSHTNLQPSSQIPNQINRLPVQSNSSPCSDAEQKACMARANAEVKNSPDYKEATSLETYSPKKIALQHVRLGQLTLKYCELCLTSKDRESILNNILRYQNEADAAK
jgi:hypothetical protein